ncbi:putative leucine-rich repeat-containing protein [Cucumis melo var. makuwa]|uniref:Putative leucine-rich repeat-containing protein n=1 Tax=Cucumis melo var. makuwa TaxID=1194695 RepID=A0A5D3BZ00_CUCMM|nr:putative leucine-rich repeat-containing protein [Cucumis melo var. makuwa]
MNDVWYFDNGCSRHMAGRSFFSELKECTSGHHTFGDGARGKVIAKENIDKNNLPCLNDVRYVDGLKANLISKPLTQPVTFTIELRLDLELPSLCMNYERSETIMETINVMVNGLEPTAKRTIDEDDEVLNVPVVSSTVPTEAPKADT